MEVRLSIQGADPIRGLQELDGWLSGEPELRGKVIPGGTPPGPDELGASTDMLIAALSSGGALSVLAGSLKAFLARPRGTDVRIVVSSPNGRSVTLEARRVHDVEALVRQVLDVSADQPPSIPSS